MMTTVAGLGPLFAASLAFRAVLLLGLGLALPPCSRPIARGRPVGVARILIEAPGELGYQTLEPVDSFVFRLELRLELGDALITPVHLAA